MYALNLPPGQGIFHQFVLIVFDGGGATAGGDDSDGGNDGGRFSLSIANFRF